MALEENMIKFTQALRDNPNHDIEEIQELIMDTSETEIRASTKQFLILCHTLSDTLVQTKRSVSGIHLMSNAILKFQTHRSQLTPLHSDFCLLCLDSKCLIPALKFLEIDHTEIKKTDDKEEDAKHVVLYYYYGGLIYTAIKNFDRASYYFEVVLTMPANAMSPVMQETYKKYVLLNLLQDGKLPENGMPKNTSQCVLRHRKQIGNSYLKLAQEYSSLNYDKIRRLVGANAGAYERDENMGLIKQCLTQVHKRNILRLTKTFLTLTLGDVANYVGLSSEKEAEAYIVNMIDDGDIFATINQRDGMVVFQDSAEKYDSVAIFKKLQDDMSHTTSLINILKKMEPETTADTRVMCKMNSDIQ